MLFQLHIVSASDNIRNFPLKLSLLQSYSCHCVAMQMDQLVQTVGIYALQTVIATIKLHKTSGHVPVRMASENKMASVQVRTKFHFQKASFVLQLCSVVTFATLLLPVPFARNFTNFLFKPLGRKKSIYSKHILKTYTQTSNQHSGNVRESSPVSPSH